MFTTNESGQEIHLDPLKLWETKAPDILMLAPLARRMLAIPASQAQSERLLLSARLITKKRSSLGMDNAELLVILKTPRQQ